MGMTLQQLISPKTKEQFRAQLLKAARGIGYVKHALGSGPGSVTPEGAATVAASVVVKIIQAGEPGVATYQYSVDGGQTWSAVSVIPNQSTTHVPIGATGVYVTFSAGPQGSYTTDLPSFRATDTYSFALSIPTFPVLSWQPGDVPLAIFDADADADADLAQVLQQIAVGGHLLDVDGTPLSYGAWLDVLAKFYGLTRKPAAVTIGQVLVTDSGGVGPLAFNPGDIVVEGSNGLRFINTTAINVALNGSTAGAFQAEQPGAAYNAPNNTVTDLVTSYPGVSVNNPDPGTGTWLTTQGADSETDNSLMVRCLARWAQLNPNTENAPELAFIGWALASDPAITRANCFPDPFSPGIIDVVVAGTNGGLGGGPVANAQAYINPLVGLCALASVISAANHVVNVTGNVTVKAAYSAQALALITTALTALFGNGYTVTNSDGSTTTYRFDIGGTVVLSQVITVIQTIPGVVDVTLTSPVGDVALGANEVATINQAIAIVPI